MYLTFVGEKSSGLCTGSPFSSLGASFFSHTLIFESDYSPLIDRSFPFSTPCVVGVALTRLVRCSASLFYTLFSPICRGKRVIPILRESVLALDPFLSRPQPSEDFRPRVPIFPPLYHFTGVLRLRVLLPPPSRGDIRTSPTGCLLAPPLPPR